MDASPMSSGGSPTLHSWGTKSDLPHSGPGGYITPKVWGSRKFERGTKSKWPTSWPIGEITTADYGVPKGSKQGTNRKWPARGQIGYITPAMWGLQGLSVGHKFRGSPQVGLVATSSLLYGRAPTFHTGKTKSEVAHKWSSWLHHPCRLGGLKFLRAGDKIRCGPQVGLVATLALAVWGFPMLRNGGSIQR